MYLSRVELNTRRRETMKVLTSPQIAHASVMASFPAFGNSNSRVLWRLDCLGPSTYLLVQSECRPDFTHIVDQFGWPASGQNWETLEYDNFLNNIKNDQTWRFRLHANPVHSVHIDGDKNSRGKVLAHVTVDQQKEWLLKRADKYGFRFATVSRDSEEPAIDIKLNEWRQFARDTKPVSINTVTFEGVLIVVDADLLRETMKTGIGRAKAYGCGMLTIARL